MDINIDIAWMVRLTTGCEKQTIYVYKSNENKMANERNKLAFNTETYVSFSWDSPRVV